MCSVGYSQSLVTVNLDVNVELPKQDVKTLKYKEKRKQKREIIKRKGRIEKRIRKKVKPERIKPKRINEKRKGVKKQLRKGKFIFK